MLLLLPLRVLVLAVPVFSGGLLRLFTQVDTRGNVFFAAGKDSVRREAPMMNHLCGSRVSGHHG